MTKPRFPAPPDGVWFQADAAGAARFLLEAGEWSIALRAWLQGAPAEVPTALRAVILGLLDGQSDVQGRLSPFPRAAVAVPSPQSAVALLEWRFRLVTYFGDVWDVIGEPRFDLGECQAVLAVLSPADAAQRCACCLMPLREADRRDHWRTCPPLRAPQTPLGPGQMAPPPAPPPGFNRDRGAPPA